MVDDLDDPSIVVGGERHVGAVEHGPRAAHVLDVLLDPDGKINAAYGVVGLPATFVIGRDGRAIALAVGPRYWASAPARTIIEALLAEPARLRGRDKGTLASPDRACRRPHDSRVEGARRGARA